MENDMSTNVNSERDQARNVVRGIDKDSKRFDHLHRLVFQLTEHFRKCDGDMPEMVQEFVRATQEQHRRRGGGL